MDVRVAEHWRLWCSWTVVLEKTLERPLDCKEIQPVHPKGDQSWVFIGRTDAEAETPILYLKRAWCWERLRAGEGDNRGWDGWMASPTQWTWVWASSGSWWWTRKLGMLQSMGSQRVDMTELLNWTGKEEIKLSLFTVDMIIYVENLKEPEEKILATNKQL